MIVDLSLMLHMRTSPDGPTFTRAELHLDSVTYRTVQSLTVPRDERDLEVLPSPTQLPCSIPYF